MRLTEDLPRITVEGMALAQLSLRWDVAPEGGARAAQRALELGLGLPAGSAPPGARNLLLHRPRAIDRRRAQKPAPRARQHDQSVGTALDWKPVSARTSALDALRALADHYAETAAAKRTRIARAQDWAAFERWCEGHALCALPAEVETLRCYLAGLAQRGLRASTIRRARCSIGLHHEQHGLPRPDRTCRTRQVERGIARAIGTREQGAEPVLPHQLTQIVESFSDSPRDVRDRALLLFGFAGGFRTSELVALRVEDLTFSEQGATVLIRSGKEDPLGRGDETEVPRSANVEVCPVHALERWLEQLGRPTAGPLFRRIDGARVRDVPMSERATSRAVQRAVARAGFVGKFSSHSLRAGLCTSAVAAGSTTYEVAKHCRMKCVQTVGRYVHLEHVPGRPNVAAGLL
jgi:site-specific recombinase XerD